jgi:hypothetical protein
MLLHRVRINHDIIQINDNEFSDKWPQDTIYKGLKRSEGVTEFKRHNLLLKLAFTRIKDSFLLISFID